MLYYVLRGLPGSGKSTEAAKIASTSGAVNVGRDIIRKSLFRAEGKKLDFSRENEVTEEQRKLIAEMAEHRVNVIADEMNLKLSYVRRHMQMASEFGYEPVVVSLLNVHPRTCMARDLERDEDRRVGGEIIMNMYNKFVKGMEPK